MSAKFKGVRRFKSYLRKHIWADFLFVFIVYFTIHIIADAMGWGVGKSTKGLILNSLGFTLIMLPFNRLMRTTEEGLGLYELVDNVRHYQIGQRPLLKTYLESQGYEVDYNEGSVTYFMSDDDKILSTSKTFLHETEYWIALVAEPKILDQVPSTISSVYPIQTS